MIIHIVGPSGAGKSFIGEKLSKIKGCKVIDTDDIDDLTCLTIIKKHPEYLDNKKNMETKYFPLVAKMNDKVVKELIDKHSKSVLIFVGITVSIKKPTHKFTINIDDTTLFTRLNLRTLSSICANKSEIEKVLSSDRSIDYKFELILKKYKVRYPFIMVPPRFSHHNKSFNDEWVKEGYKSLSADKIYDEVVKLILNFNPK